MTTVLHQSVLEQKVLEFLDPKSGHTYCDGTLGAGGHSRAILGQSAPDGRLIGIDRDPNALAISQERLAEFGDRVTIVRGSFDDVASHLESVGIELVDGFLLDLGVSSMQFDNGERGFSFTRDGPIDMRMDPDDGEDALALIRRLSQEELANVIYRYGEERFSRRIADRLKRAIDNDALGSTAELASEVAAALPAAARRKSKIHPATRTFQALRIAVNDELGQLERFLAAFVTLLAPGGRCVIISFHSLEDRMVKNCFRDLAKSSSLPADLAKQAGERVEPLCRVVTRKVVIADNEEIERNPRARSARLRACERLAA